LGEALFVVGVLWLAVVAADRHGSEWWNREKRFTRTDGEPAQGATTWPARRSKP
jgi:hypothetical protein